MLCKCQYSSHDWSHEYPTVSYMKNEYGVINTRTNIENYWYAIYVPGGKEEQAKEMHSHAKT